MLATAGALITALVARAAAPRWLVAPPASLAAALGAMRLRAALLRSRLTMLVPLSATAAGVEVSG